MISIENQRAETGMLIRKPAGLVYEAVIDPRITTRFWFTKSTGRLDENIEVTWSWELYKVSASVKVQLLVPNEKIIMQWGNSGDETTVEWTFTALDEARTFVGITEHGFKGSEDRLISSIRDSTGGFSWVLAGMKALLEHNITLNLVADRFPAEMRSH